MAKRSTREKIVEAATERFHTLGYTGCGVLDILAHAGVPKGSFYNHFKSKELLAVEVFRIYGNAMNLGLLADVTFTPLERIRNSFSHMGARYNAWGLERGCTLTKFAQEFTDETPILRDAIRASVTTWLQLLGDAIRAGQADGTIKASLDAEQVARYLIASWQGVATSIRVTAQPTAIDDFLTLALGALTAA